MTDDDARVAEYRRERAPHDPFTWDHLGEAARNAWRHQYHAVIEDAEGAA